MCLGGGGARAAQSACSGAHWVGGRGATGREAAGTTPPPPPLVHSHHEESARHGVGGWSLTHTHTHEQVEHTHLHNAQTPRDAHSRGTTVERGRTSRGKAAEERRPQRSLEHGARWAVPHADSSSRLSGSPLRRSVTATRKRWCRASGTAAAPQQRRPAACSGRGDGGGGSYGQRRAVRKQAEAGHARRAETRSRRQQHRVGGRAHTRGGRACSSLNRQGRGCRRRLGQQRATAKARVKPRARSAKR